MTKDLRKTKVKYHVEISCTMHYVLVVIIVITKFACINLSVGSKGRHSWVFDFKNVNGFFVSNSIFIVDRIKNSYIVRDKIVRSAILITFAYKKSRVFETFSKGNDLLIHLEIIEDLNCRVTGEF